MTDTSLSNGVNPGETQIIIIIVQNLGMMNKMKISQEGPMYIHTKFNTYACLHAHMFARNMKRACMHALISQAK